MVTRRCCHESQSIQKVIRWLFVAVEVWEEIRIWFCSESRQKGWCTSLFCERTKREIEIKKWEYENVFKDASYFHDLCGNFREKLFKLWWAGIRRGITYLKEFWEFCWRWRELRLKGKKLILNIINIFIWMEKISDQIFIYYNFPNC